MVSANETASEPAPELDNYVGTTRWVSPKHPVSICDAPIDYTGSMPRCERAPANSAISIEQRTFYTSNLGIQIHSGYRVHDSKGRPGFISSLDPILMMDDAEKKRAEASRADCDRRGGVSIGMSKAQVFASCWGRPSKVNETLTANGHHEQWVYGGGYVYLDNGVVTSIQTTH